MFLCDVDGGENFDAYWDFNYALSLSWYMLASSRDFFLCFRLSGFRDLKLFSIYPYTVFSSASASCLLWKD